MKNVALKLFPSSFYKSNFKFTWFILLFFFSLSFSLFRKIRKKIVFTANFWTEKRKGRGFRFMWKSKETIHALSGTQNLILTLFYLIIPNLIPRKEWCVALDIMNATWMTRFHALPITFFSNFNVKENFKWSNDFANSSLNKIWN